jgi:hypothetical protein
MDRRPLTIALMPLLTLALAIAACEERPAAAPKQEQVPMGLVHEVPIEEDKAPKSVDDPDNAPPPANGPTPIAVPTANSATSVTEPPAKTGPKVSKSQCQALFKKYVKLVVAGNPALQGVPDAVVDQALGQTDAKMGGNPCDEEKDRPTKGQADCATKAKTKEAWETCLK